MEPERAVEDDLPGFDRFGFVAYPLGCSFDGGEIRPLSDHAQAADWARVHSYRVGSQPRADWRDEHRILFPPTAFERRGRKELPNTRRPATIFRAPSTHGVRLDGVDDLAAVREGASGFVIKAFAFLFDSPAQFHDWWFDGAVSLGGDSLDPTEDVAAGFLSTAYRTWLSWPTEQQQAMIAVLKMHARAPGYQWYWERFAWEYTVSDACYAIAAATVDEDLPKRQDHGQRLRRLTRLFAISATPEESDWIKTIVDLRNELIHEARWAGSQPSTKTPHEGPHAPLVLHQLNQRLIVALLGFDNRFVHSRWSRNGHHIFELPEGGS